MERMYGSIQYGTRGVTLRTYVCSVGWARTGYTITQRTYDVPYCMHTVRVPYAPLPYSDLFFSALACPVFCCAGARIEGNCRMFRKLGSSSW